MAARFLLPAAALVVALLTGSAKAGEANIRGWTGNDLWAWCTGKDEAVCLGGRPEIAHAGMLTCAPEKITTACQRHDRHCAPATSTCLSGAKHATDRRQPICSAMLIDTGRGDTPLIHLRYRCSKCRSGLTDWVVTSKYGGRPAWNRDV